MEADSGKNIPAENFYHNTGYLTILLYQDFSLFLRCGGSFNPFIDHPRFQVDFQEGNECGVKAVVEISSS